MSDFGDMRVVKTRKPHRCEWCGEDIPLKSEVQYFGGMWQGDWQSWYMHFECYNSYNEDRDWDGEFYPYEHQRGSQEAR